MHDAHCVLRARVTIGSVETYIIQRLFVISRLKRGKTAIIPVGRSVADGTAGDGTHKEGRRAEKRGQDLTKHHVQVCSGKGLPVNPRSSLASGRIRYQWSVAVFIWQSGEKL